jgi:hypothetical protein
MEAQSSKQLRKSCEPEMQDIITATPGLILRTAPILACACIGTAPRHGKGQPMSGAFTSATSGGRLGMANIDSWCPLSGAFQSGIQDGRMRANSRRVRRTRGQSSGSSVSNQKLQRRGGLTWVVVAWRLLHGDFLMPEEQGLNLR